MSTKSRAWHRAVQDIERADEHIPIRDVLRLTGCGYPGGTRADCPVCGEDRALVLHDDGDENWAWCHGCGTGYGPVRLYAAWQHGDTIPPACRARAARELMELSGIGPQALRGLHEDARQRAAAQLPRIATECLAAALAAWCEATRPRLARASVRPGHRTSARPLPRPAPAGARRGRRPAVAVVRQGVHAAALRGGRGSVMTTVPDDEAIRQAFAARQEAAGAVPEDGDPLPGEPLTELGYARLLSAAYGDRVRYVPAGSAG